MRLLTREDKLPNLKPWFKMVLAGILWIEAEVVPFVIREWIIFV